ncbi:MAG: hypothetical protein GF419_00225 [Ignavibacteriales bacterium]|nr:hypothetical protein [Ignavibacteriales bacterium]
MKEDIISLMAHGALEMKGDVRAKGNFTLDGRLEGNIEGDRDVTVGDNGDVLGNIKGRNVYVKGKVVGDIVAQLKLTLGPDADFKGDVTTRDVVISDGARFDGKILTTESKKTGGGAPTPKPTPDASQQKAGNAPS